DFIGIQTSDLEGARAFYEGIMGLSVIEAGPPDAVVFDSKPIPFAVRTPLVDLEAVETLGHGVALWFGCDDADALHHHLVQNDVAVVFPPKEGPFGRYFAFRDPFCYTITAHTNKSVS
ncbi:MAG: VOC family protein, partial [Pseudomonadota bacterium]